MDRNASLRKNIYSIVVTLTIIAVIIIAGPVEAVRVNLKTDKGVYHSDDTSVVFTVGIDIQRGETVPLEKITLNINDGYRICEFLPDGTNSCPNIDIVPVSHGIQVTDDLYGRGFGFVADEKPRTVRTDFGYGYGFDEELHKSGYRGELAYQITWHMVADGAQDGKYSANLFAYAHNSGNNFTYMTTSPKRFHLNLDNTNNKAVVTGRVTAYSRDGAIDMLGAHNSLDRENDRFFATLKHTQKDGVEGVTGRAAMIFSGKDNGAAVTARFTMTDFTKINSFTKDKIDVEGIADVYHYTKFVPPVRERFKMPVRFVIENGEVVVTAADPRLQTDATFTLNRFSFR